MGDTAELGSAGFRGSGWTCCKSQQRRTQVERDSSVGDAAAEDDRWECALLFEWVSGDR